MTSASFTLETVPSATLKEAERQHKHLTRNAVKVEPAGLLLEKLAKSLHTGVPLKVKLGADPTAPDIHLGHTVPLQKLREFQDFGHTAQLLIGDFTASIGDPSGRSKTRPPLSAEAIAVNAATYAEQAFKVLDKAKTTIVYNNTWCAKLSPADLIKMLSHVTVSQILQREDFHNRYTEGVPIAMHELLYPIMQGYDSVVLESDVEIGGTDQLFNCLMGREMQKLAGKPQQVVLSMPLLEGLDGVQKMSKSLGNYIAVQDDPVNMFGKTMSIPDALMPRYFEFLTDLGASDIPEHPMQAKKLLGRTLVERFHSHEAALAAQADFETRFSKNEIPADLPEHVVPLPPEGLGLLTLMTKLNLCASNGEARRLVEQGGVKQDGISLRDPKHVFSAQTDDFFVLQAGKRKMVRVKISSS